MLDIVIISVPGISSNLPPAAPALLKASVEQAGFSCLTQDYNQRLYQMSEIDVSALSTYFSTGLNKDQEELANALVDQWAQDLAKIPCRYIGISVFTQQSRIATRMFCQVLKKYSSASIVLGGQGLSDGGIGGNCGFGRELKQQGLCAHYIRSEGEISLVELLRGNFSYPGIDSDHFQQVDNLDNLPFPDYSDYDLAHYDSRELPVTGSRGCVRSCSFCDIHEHWKFRYRDGKKIAHELIHLQQQYGINEFRFTDSLVNGNLREFRKFIKILSEHNQTAEVPIRWNGQFIVRSKSGLPQDYWQQIRDSGGHSLAIGVETGSDQVRTHMNKRFTNADLDYTMEQLSQHGITCVFLMIVGYPTETEQDFQDTLDMFVRYRHLAGKIIRNVSVGTTLGILPGTPLHHRAEEFNIELDRHENNWIAWDNPDLTFTRRISRRHELWNHLEALGFHSFRDPTEHTMRVLEQNQEQFEKRANIKRMYRLRQIRSQSQA